MKKTFLFFRFTVVSFLLVILISPVLFISCKAVPQSPENAEMSPDIVSGGSPRTFSNDSLVAVFHKGNLELDPRMSYMSTEAQLFTAIYEGLFSYHPITLSPVPAAASSWEVSVDRREWTFHIREDARYENGDPLRAQDFRNAWLSLLEPEREAPYSSLFDVIEGAREFRTGMAGAAQVGITVVNDKTLVVRLNSPAAFFPSMLCHHSFSPIHPSMLNVDGWTRPVSNGPFVIEEMDEDIIVLSKNDNYWDARQVSLNSLVLRFTADPDEAAALWNSGEARWVNSGVNYEALTDRSGIELNAMFATNYFYIRSAREPWNDYRLRRALSLVLPWEEIRRGYILPASTLIFPLPDYPDIAGLEANDIDEALRLVTEAGYPGGVGLPELVIRINPSQESQRLALIMVEAWYTILGVNIRIDMVSFDEYFDSTKLNDHDVASITWIGDFIDPYAFLQMWRRGSNLNEAGHNDNEFEALIERSMNEEGIPRMETLAEAEELLLHRGNVIPIAFYPALNIISMNEIDGWYPNVMDIHPFKYLSIRTRMPLPGVVELPESNGSDIVLVRN